MTTFVNVSYTSDRPKDLVLYPEKEVDPLLRSLLGVVTPHKTERVIVDIIRGVAPNVETLGGNAIVSVGENITTMFSSHMDTVSDVCKENKKKGLLDRVALMTSEDQHLIGMMWGAKVFRYPSGEILYQPSTLGADDKVGVYIMLKMIQKKIPGLYVFHEGEECGGIGSKFLSTQHKSKFVGLKRAIAFDRANYGDVISFQRGARCCSITFGKALAAKLNEYMPPKQQFSEGVRGTFTDTASYTDIIGECTNISVGYFNQHGSQEKLDYTWLKHILLPTILKTNFDELPSVRKPGEKDVSYGGTTYYYNKNSNYMYKDALPWSEATKDTEFSKLPKWTPEMGYVEEAHPEVLYKSIERFFKQELTSYPEKEKFTAHYFEMLEDYYMLLEENLELKKEIKNLRKVLNPKESTDELVARQLIIGKLVEAAKDKELILDIKSEELLGKYLKGAKIVLKLTAEPTDNQIRGMDRLILQLGYFLSLDQRNPDTIPQSTKVILKEADEYLNKNSKTFRITHEVGTA